VHRVEQDVAVERLLEELRAQDIRLRVEGGDLRVSAPPGALTAALREVLRWRKAELLPGWRPVPRCRCCG